MAISYGKDATIRPALREGKMNEIVPDVLTWSRPSERHGYDFNRYLVRHPQGNLCVDPVEPSEAVLNQIAAIGATRILLTNRNHTRAANLFCSRVGARTAIHPKDADYAHSQGAQIDDSFDVGERIGPLQVIGIPGKSPGEVGLFWQERNLLIVGDAVIGNPPGRYGLLPEKVIDDPLQLKQSLQAMLALDFDTLLMGDGSSIVSHGKDRLKELLASFHD
jgi:glyoxylase-like metal-dependent hydrolase (beta-lactamase superfamily II)